MRRKLEYHFRNKNRRDYKTDGKPDREHPFPDSKERKTWRNLPGRKGKREWKYKAYDYVRTDAFCCGQNIPIELEFGQDETNDLQAILLTEDHKPVAGCRIAFRRKRDRKKSGINTPWSEKQRKADTTAYWSKPLRNG